MNENQRDRGKAIHRETGQTFYYATRLLPERIREQTYVLYGFFRVADEVVDDGSAQSAAAQRDRLESMRSAALGNSPADEPVIEAFSAIREEEGIADEEVEAFIDAMCTDIDTDRYETYEELEEYMRGSAAAVGNMMTTIMDVDHPDSARSHAMALGEAFQLTNFIRDVREDIRELDRIYLPMETLAQYNVTAERIEREQCTPELRRAVKSELRRAEQLYREGVKGIEHLPDDCQFAVVLAAVLYAEHHRLIRKQDYDVLSTRPELSKPRKLFLVAKTWWNWRRYEDPVTVFRRVSAVPTDEAVSGDAEHAVPSIK